MHEFPQVEPVYKNKKIKQKFGLVGLVGLVWFYGTSTIIGY